MQATGIATREIMRNDVKRTVPPWNVPEAVREQFRRVKAVLRTRDAENLCIAVCSHESGEGVSWVVSKLACALAEDSLTSVLVMDASCGQGTQANLFAVQSGEAKEIAREGSVSFLLRPSGSARLSIVAPKFPGPDSKMLLNGALLAALPRLRQFAQVVLIDCQPMTRSAQLLHLGNAIDGVLFVVEAERERREVIGHSLEAVKRAGIPLSGVLLNKRKRYIPDAFYRLL